MSPSLRTRLLKSISIPLVLGLLAIGVGSYHSAGKEADKIYDAQLAHFAHVLHELSLHEVHKGEAMHHAVRTESGMAATPYEKDLSYRVWLGDRLILQSSNAQVIGDRMQQPGFADRSTAQHQLRLFMLRKDNVAVEVAENYRARTDLIHQMAVSTWLPFFFIIPLLGLAIFYGLRIGLKPLDTLSAYVAGLRPDALQHIGGDISLPRELAPFVASINQLMHRVEEVIEREKRFTGYAAHELRTPLAALKTQLQVAQREKDKAARLQMYAEAVEGIDRMAHLVNQLLLLLRSQKDGQVLEEVGLSQLMTEEMAVFERAVTEKQQVLFCAMAPGIMCMGNAGMLRVLVRNLLDNACRYSPEGAQIKISLMQEEGGGPQLEVHNSGVHVTAEECTHMSEPFYRGKATVASGAGLGLAIVSWIARMHHWQVQIIPEKNGLCVRIFDAAK